MSQADMERRAFHIEGAAGSKAQRQGIEWHKFEHCQVLQYDWNVECKEGRWHEMMLEEEPGGMQRWYRKWRVTWSDLGVKKIAVAVWSPDWKCRKYWRRCHHYGDLDLNGCEDKTTWTDSCDMKEYCYSIDWWLESRGEQVLRISGLGHEGENTMVKQFFVLLLVVGGEVISWALVMWNLSCVAVE